MGKAAFPKSDKLRQQREEKVAKEEARRASEQTKKAPKVAKRKKARK